jgi:hypothetical protein
MSCNQLALKLGRRRAHVLAVLRDDPAFQRVSAGRWTRWRRTDVERDVRGRGRDVLQGHGTPDPYSEVTREILSRLSALERLVGVQAPGRVPAPTNGQLDIEAAIRLVQEAAT